MKARNTYRPLLETLEDRVVPVVTSVAADAFNLTDTTTLGNRT
jgi:hypothetical protein